jgi:pimeloyl-[acyl-carrier protein] methyl ester esterase
MTNPPVHLRSLGSDSLPELVLVHGWGLHSAVLQPLVDELTETFRIHVLDLPGYGPENSVSGGEEALRQSWTLESLLDEFLNLPIGSAIWCGWSLGGMLAAYHAACYPSRVQGLVTIASNACFAQRQDWLTAMPQIDYERFVHGLETDPDATLGRFAGLVAQGSATARHDLRTLKALVTASGTKKDVLRTSLNLLHELDTRPALASLAMPQTHIFGARDSLVPVSAASVIALLNARAEIRVIEDAGHAPFFSHPQAVAEALKALAGLL